jgi:Leucine-rich repeat (LRR) protein
MKNQISTLEFLEPLAKLQILMLDENNIQELEQLHYLQFCPAIKQLTLSYNPICDDQYFVQAV